MQFRRVTHVIFDLDGTLIDSETVYDKIVIDLLKAYGKEYTKEVRYKVRGTPEAESCKTLVKEFNLPISAEDFTVLYRKKVDEELQRPALMPGAMELVKHLYDNDVPLAVATSSTQSCMDMKMQTHKDLMKMFHHSVCGGSDPEVKRGKPAPDIFLVCSSRFPDKPNPCQVLVIEDAATGIKGARAAGMQVVMVPSPDIDDELKKPATLLLNSLNEFKPEQFGLPARK